MSREISITVNDQTKALPEGAVVAGLLESLGLTGRKGIAVAVDGAVIPRSTWGARELKPGEKVILIQATQGG